MNEIELYFVMRVKNGQVVGTVSGPYVNFDDADAEIAKHKFSASNYRVGTVKLPFQLIER